MSDSLRKLMTEDRRLVILRLMTSVPEYSLNSIVLMEALRNIAHSTSLDIIQDDLNFLSSHELVTVKNHGSDLMKVTLTTRGKSVALGQVKVPGVKVPEPGLDDDEL